MKAIIMERRGAYAAVLCEDGTFVKTRQQGEIGEVIELNAKVLTFPKKRGRWLKSAVAAVLMLTVAGSTVGYTTASAYVSLDVEDAAIELTVNHFGRVIAVDAVNEDDEELAEQLYGEIKHKRAEDALDRAMDQLRGRERPEGADAALYAGVTSDSPRQQTELRQLVERSVERGGEVPIYVFETSRAERREAMEQNISTGRFGFRRDHGFWEAEAVPPGFHEPAGPAAGAGYGPDAVPPLPEEPGQFLP